MSQLQSINHIVVLMLENRSFDSLLGMLYPKSDGFEGLLPNRIPMRVARRLSSGTVPAPKKRPRALDRHQHATVRQLRAGAGSETHHGRLCPKLSRPTTIKPATNLRSEKRDALFCTRSGPSAVAARPKIRSLRPLVASAPCQTWPNRWFVHAATADGHENNDPPHFPDVPTIFNRLEQAGIDNWKIYFHDIAQAHTLLQLFLLGSHFHSYRQFQADCQTGQLPAYSFIEPQYFADFGHPENDQHPPSVVTLGEQLIADVYNCLRASRVWRKTLLARKQL